MSETLEERVNTLETSIKSLNILLEKIKEWGKVIVVVLSIFGIGGSWGMWVFQTASTELIALRENVNKVKTDINNLDRLAEDAVKNAMKKYIRIPSELPSHVVVAFNLLRCPEGWIKFEKASGRYIVALKENGELGAVVGTELVDKENRASGNHTHTYNVSQSAGGVNIPSNGGSYAAPANVVLTTNPNKTPSGADALNGTNAPYVQLLLCEKLPIE